MSPIKLLRPLAAAGPISIAVVVSHASDLKNYITGSASGSVTADFYWPLENSFISDMQTGAIRINAFGHEANGIYDNPCPPPNPPGSPPAGEFFPVEYFPLLPDHMTRVARSTALILGETTGDLAPAGGDQADRYIEFDFSAVTTFSTQPLEAFGMHHKDEWTVHMVVSPDADGTDARGWETLFDIGNDDYINPSTRDPQPIRVTIDADRRATDTLFRIRTQAQGNPVRTATATVPDTALTHLNGRPWYQVIAQYYKPGPSDPYRIRIIVHTITDGSTPAVHRTSANAQSNEWRNDTDGVARIGLDLEDANPFHGAVHHFAVWKKLVDTDDDVFDELDQIADAFAAAYKDPDPRAPLAVDWDADPRFFIWDRPLEDSVPTARTPWNWRDPMWDLPGVYPFVRFFSNAPNNGGTNSTPPDLTVGGIPMSWTQQPGETPEDIGEQAANWIEYIDAGLGEYGSDTVTKSLHDTDACALLWHNWGGADGSCFYTDLRASRSLMRNWRDVQAAWRNSASHPTVALGSFAEIMSPFYREGMSVNAFRSKDTFIALRDRIDAESLPMPTRLHFDTEERPNFNQAWGGTLTNDYVEGWWDDAMESTGGLTPTSVDTRSDDVAHWAPPTVPGGFDTLFQLGTSFATDPRTMNRYTNPELTAKFGRFARDQYDHAFGVSLLIPALQELNPDIRLSEYGALRAGSTADTEFVSKVGHPLQNVHPVWSDFSSPVLYPVNQQSIVAGGSGDTLYAQWGNYLGVLGLLVTDDYADNGRLTATPSEVLRDTRTVFVEHSKRKINASYLTVAGTNDPWEGEPIAPWLPYPGQPFYIDGRFDIDQDGTVEFNGDDALEHVVTKHDVARIAAFAHRRGVREFLFWGNLASGNLADPAAVAEGIEFVVQTVDHVRARPTDYTTTGAVPGDPEYGVPDGIVDIDDFGYFYAFTDPSDPFYGNIEGDYSGPDGYPDGVVDTTYDFPDFYLQWMIDQYL